MTILPYERDRYRQIIKRILLQHTERPPGHGEIEMRPVFDEKKTVIAVCYWM